MPSSAHQIVPDSATRPKEVDPGVTPTSSSKALSDQIRMFKRYGMGNLKTLLVELSKDPAMIIWLDNQQNHKPSTGAINENFGRELLELFSMGVGNWGYQRKLWQRAPGALLDGCGQLHRG